MNYTLHTVPTVSPRGNITVTSNDLKISMTALLMKSIKRIESETIAETPPQLSLILPNDRVLAGPN